MLRSGNEMYKSKALSFFILNTQSYPSSYNAYDSLGEAYDVLGDKKKAIESYKKAIELYPNNDYILNKIETLSKNE